MSPRDPSRSVAPPRRPRRALRVALAALLAGAWCASVAAPPGAVAGGSVLDGQAAPELALVEGLNGASAATTIAAFRGRVVCLKFWLTRCPVCRATLPEFQAMHDRYGRSGLVCLGVVIDRATGVGPYLQEAGWTFAVGCDPESKNAAKYGVTRYPADYVIGADGVVRASNGFPREVILEELRKQRVMEWGAVPDALRGVRDLVEDGDYGGALKQGEGLARAPGASAEVRQAVERLQGIAKQRQENRLLRADELAKAGSAAEAKAEYERVIADFAGTTLEARARERLAAFLASQKPR